MAEIDMGNGDQLEGLNAFQKRAYMIELDVFRQVFGFLPTEDNHGLMSTKLDIKEQQDA